MLLIMKVILHIMRCGRQVLIKNEYLFMEAPLD